jgi:hypothetical protein
MGTIIYWCIFFFIRNRETKKDIIKISSNIIHFTNITQHLPTVSLNIFFNIFAPLPFTGFTNITNFTSKFYLFNILPVNLKPGKSSTLIKICYDGFGKGKVGLIFLGLVR